MLLVAFALGASAPALGQRAEENAVTSAEDAFGTTIGRESIGLYSEDDVRGFSPASAGNVRIEGLFFDQQTALSSRVRESSTIDVGIGSQAHAFPAPTGIINVELRQASSTPMLSGLLSFGPFSGKALELDGQLPLLVPGLTTAIGASISENRFGDGGQGTNNSFGIVPRWSISDNVRAIGFWERFNVYDENPPAIYVPSGSFLPPRIRRGVYPGPSWARSDSIEENAGAIVDATLGNWTYRAGLFKSKASADTSFTNLLEEVTPDRTASRLIIADPPSSAASISGEVRVSYGVTWHSIDHLFTTSVRMRNVSRLSGGSDFIEFGTMPLDEPLTALPPAFHFRDRARDKVKQETLGLGYTLGSATLGKFGLGIQRTRYRKSVSDPQELPQAQSESRLWLPNATFSVNAGPNMVVFGSFVRGLEEAESAPETALNRSQLPDATRTEQRDLGARLRLPLDAIFTLAYFDISKPYLTLDNQLIYRELGQQRNRGIEMSLTASFDALTVLLGGVLTQPRVTGVGDAGDVIGERPLAQSERIFQIDADYTIPFAPSLSIDASVRYRSGQAATVDNSVSLPAQTTMDLGGRYKFMAGKSPMTLRALVTNITNRYDLLLEGPGTYATLDQRAINVSLAMDF
jgi:iron complex outermembrane receptor protein